ncbi:MAG: Eco57I restriction-modification methylase domain-containing protein, partial [Clostridia bacterium]|nr:Eco57I restriction-modification methylase domain-containing protein [Clostridia bacterium]
VEGTVMHTYDVPEMMRQIKRISVEAAINSGFDDDTIYKSDAGLVVTDYDASILKKLSDVVVPKGKSKKQSEININDLGMTDEERKAADRAKKKKKKDLTPEEKEALEKLKKQKKEQRKMFDLLRAVSIRLPLLFYGADADITEIIHLKDFVNLVDDESWSEFMPKGLGKPLFLDILRYYDEDVVTGAGLRIRKLAKAADELPPTLRARRIVEIMSRFKNPDKETVLTPWRVVNMHLGDTIGGYNFYDETYTKEVDAPHLIDHDPVTADILLNEDAKILEMNSKSGLYPLYMTYSIYMMYVDGDEMKLPLEKAQEIWFRTLEKNIFVLCKTKMARTITIRTLAGYSGKTVNAICLPKLIEERMKDIPRLARKLRNPATWGKEGEGKMKFDAVVGNPPYQEEGISTRKQPVYHYFYDTAFQLSPLVSLITPGRFLFDAGQTPKEWNAKMLNDKHFKVVKYFPNSTDVFSTVDIKGGVVITIRNEEIDFGAIGVFAVFEQLNSIVSKVNEKEKENKKLNSIIASQGLFRFSNLFFDEHPEVINMIGAGTGNKIVSSVMEKMPGIFVDLPDSNEEHIRMLGRIDGKRSYKYIKKKYIVGNEYIDKFKVFLPEANSTGKFGEILTEPVIGNPNDGSADTYLCGGLFESIDECFNFISYFKTKFFRCLLGVKKATQHCPPGVWEMIPLQDFTPNSDIDWSVSIPEIDAQLYKKYGLSEDEIEFIETNVQSMENDP